MVTMLDKFGRVVIPKKVRDDLGLKPGVMLDVREEDRELVLSPQVEQPEVITKDGLLVFTGKVMGNIRDSVKEHRQEHLRKTAAIS
ncbi:hypothetical protein MNBD_UNCLBAC01-1473 [hydrothermal vent metagenome]|uniref:SpoVT-AbrB domain-containing protein n=1 Tax=hydrothermal vent metagenome TaxID=652676 RepID=A0A3B1DFM4_9ZZZZ